MKKILIMYATYGGGHQSAAKSIKSYIDENYPDYETNIVDCIKYINRPVNYVSVKAYNRLTTNLPAIWKKVYYNSGKGFLSKVSNGTNKIMAKKLYRLFKEYQPDLVISTHMFATQMTGYLKRKGKIDCPLATVLTDFAPHGQWLEEHEQGNFFFVSNNGMKKSLIEEYHVQPEKIYVTGIPISPKFAKGFDKNYVYKSMDLNPDLKTILLFGGGKYGIGRKKVLEVLNCLTQHLDEYQIVAVSGKNKKMIKSFKQLHDSLPDSINLKIYDYVTNVPEIMSISSFVVTKPGGLTSSESLASGLPVVVINPIPGQEEENAEYLVNHGAAIWIKKKEKAEPIISELLSSPNKLEEMSANSRKCARINSTKEICDTILKSTFDYKNN